MKKYFCYLLILTLLLPGAGRVQAESYRMYTVKSGLSENTVRCIMQDSMGYMWFATKDGLNRFNGQTFTHYACSSSPRTQGEMSHLNILALLQHKDGRRIWVGTKDNVLLFDPVAEEFVPVDELNRDKFTTSGQSLCYDAAGDLWIGSEKGLLRYDEEEKQLYRYRHLTNERNTLPSNNVTSLFCDSSGTVWVGTGNGLAKYNRQKDDFTRYNKSWRSGDSILCFSEDVGGRIWVGTWYSGFARLNPADGQLSFLSSGQEGALPRVRDILHEDDGTTWLCSDMGFFRYDRRSRVLERQTFASELMNNSIYSCYRDREGSLWIGTYFNGVCYLSPKNNQIECYTPKYDSDRFSGGAVSEFQEDRHGRIWVATENGGLSLFDPERKQFVKTPHHHVDDNVHALAIMGDELWIGTFSKGLRRIDLKSGRTYNYMERNKKTPIPDNHVYALHRGSEGKLYIGTMHGCSVYDPADRSFTHIDSLKRYFIYDIIEDGEGNIWFGDYGSGLHRYNRETGSWKHYKHSASDPKSLCNNRVIRLYIDKKQQLWVCTEGGGVCSYDYKNDRFVRPHVDSEDGRFPSSVIFGVLDDGKGELWFSSNHGLIRYNPDKGSFRRYTYEDGLQSNQFNYRSSFKSSDGKFYFGGIDGFNSFFPHEIVDNNIAPNIAAEVQMEERGGKIIRSHKIYDSGKITVPNNVSTIILHFECLSYVSPDNNHFEYKINERGDWTVTSQSSLSFVDLRPGNYEIKVRSINGDGYRSTNECLISLEVRPPFWMSGGAISGYLLLICIVLAGISWAIQARRSRNTKERIREIEMEKEQEAYQAKILFFTQIAHEIKTPLSLIKGPLEVIQEHKTWDKGTENNLNIIEKNTKRLMDLITQLLDFRKINSEGYKLRPESIDMNSLIDSVTTRFKGERQISFQQNLPEEPLICDVDAEAMTKIVSNLLTNAVKFTADRIDIGLSLSPDGSSVCLSVRDNGPGIAKEEQEQIFDSFYQSANVGKSGRIPGVGLGLSLVRMLCEKHGGRVFINEKYTDGCEICVELPYRDEIRLSENVAAGRPAEDDKAKINVLVVEDESSLQEFLMANLSKKCNVYTAFNGREALEILSHKSMDVIVSDISMPQMDGFALLQEVRKNELLCHIPFILLTAETSVESKIQGMDIGADAYMEKPFSLPHLRAMIENLHNRRLMLQQKVSSNPLEKYNQSGLGDRDAKWMEKVDSVIGEHLNDSNFSIEFLADSLCMGRSNFQRKLKGVTGMPPNDYIRLFRLKRAAEILSEGKMAINEVCYIVGFCNPSYFSSCFKKQFGVLPKDFIQSQRGG